MHHTHTPSRGTATLAALTTAALTLGALTGCSSSTGGSSKSTGAGATAAAAAAQTPLAAASVTSSATPATGTKNIVAIEALDSASGMSYRISGSPHAGLATLEFTNKGDEAHEMGLSRLKDGVTLGQLKKLLLSGKPDSEQKARALQIDPDIEIGGPAILGPGLSEKVVLPLKPGHYLVTCFLPGKNGMPHAAMGMIGEFSVGRSGSVAASPDAQGLVTLTDHGITVPAGFAGDGTFQIANKGTKPHDFSIAKLAGAPLPAYFQCVAGSFGKGTPIDKCPGTLSGGVMTVAPGASVYLTLPKLATGKYGYVSTQGDGADFQAGLNGMFTVK